MLVRKYKRFLEWTCKEEGLDVTSTLNVEVKQQLMYEWPKVLYPKNKRAILQACESPVASGTGLCVANIAMRS